MAGRRRTPVPAAKDPTRGRREERWEQRSGPRPLPCLDHQLSKSPGARRRALRPASLIPPSPSLPEGTLPLSTRSSSRVPRVSSPAQTSSSLVPRSQRPFPSRPDGAKRLPDRIPPSSRLAKDRERLIPLSSSRPRREERSSKSFPGHAHRRERSLIPGERAIPRSSDLIPSGESHPISGERSRKSASSALKSPSNRTETAWRPAMEELDSSFSGGYYMYIMAVCPEPWSRGLIALTDRAAPPSQEASSPRRGGQDRRRRFFDK
jgi:hypothetical protein